MRHYNYTIKFIKSQEKNDKIFTDRNDKNRKLGLGLQISLEAGSTM